MLDVQATETTMFVSMLSFFYKISDASVGGIYLTLLKSATLAGMCIAIPPCRSVHVRNNDHQITMLDTALPPSLRLPPRNGFSQQQL